ncbi:sensor histidine kinase [Leptolyngbya sp. KIOST-1]|uniref:sensor histidine kinase n=1 Tax=Leptolyngbya sp. KIOST-1 TaxID=1229172 RepID=UPI001CEC3F86|nr:sensor histidine kinase [Leptolyngbya sp. KIOST-1]
MAGTLLPVVLFAGAIVYRLSYQEQAAAERRILREARNLAATVDREFSNTTRTLQALAASDQLVEGDLEGFYGDARRVEETQATWMTVILLSPDGQQLLNTRQPLGVPLPSVNEPASLTHLVATQRPVVGDLSRGNAGKNYAFPIRVPVIQDGVLRYALTAVITPQAMATVVEEQQPVEGEWTRTILDGQGVVVTRTLNPQQFVGQRGTPSFLRRIEAASEGVYQDLSLEGMEVYVAFSRISNTPWTAAVTIPIQDIQGPARQAMGLVIGSGMALLLISGLGAYWLSRPISRSFTAAALAAEALANNEHPQLSSRSIKEVALLGRSLEVAANLLAERDRERAEHLERAEMAKEEAERANRLKDEFLAVLSHELRTPLNPILGWASLLRDGQLSAEKTAFALETIERNAKLQTQLIDDLLDVTRIMQGKTRLTMVPVDLVAIVVAALETVRLTAEAKAIAIQTLFEPELGPVLGDSTRLQQVIWNLLSNAVKFTDSGGQVVVTVAQVGAEAQVQVSDTGKGIHPGFLGYVFEYFRQEDGTTTRKFGGLGLGLAIVRNLVELHGGTVVAASPGEGQGATFTVRLPLLPSQADRGG